MVLPLLLLALIWNQAIQQREVFLCMSAQLLVLGFTLLTQVPHPVWFKYSVSGVSGPGTTRDAPIGLDASRGNTNPTGISVTETGLYIVNDAAGQEKIFIYPHGAGAIRSIDLISENSSPTGIGVVTDDSDVDIAIYVTDSSNVFAYSPVDGATRPENSDFSLDPKNTRFRWSWIF